MESYGCVIDGETRTTSSTFDVLNPATEEVTGLAPDCTEADLDDAMAAAHRAFLTWRSDEDARRQTLRDAAAALMADADRIGRVLTAEQGRPLQQAILEVFGAATWLTYYADLEVPRHFAQDDGNARAEIRRRPMGVVAAITPWNFPLVLACWKLAPALRAGNTVVLKPSPFTPLATLLMGEVIAQQLPAGVLNVVTGGDALGAAMTSHPVPRKVSFTGSVATGKAVAAAAAPDLKRMTLELGGNDAAIVLDDADVGAIAESIFTNAFMNCGQICSAIKRVYVHSSLAGDLIDALAEQAKGVVVGDGMDPDTQMGPINNAPQYERVRNLLSDAMGQGGEAVVGGAPLDGPGYFIAPTIMRGVSDGTRIVDEEQFGPVLPVMAFDDVDKAIARANGTQFGLSGSVWSGDQARAEAVAAELECGTAWVNTHLALAPHLPFGGVKWSGIGVENGPWGLDAFTDIQVLYTHQPTADGG